MFTKTKPNPDDNGYENKAYGIVASEYAKKKDYLKNAFKHDFHPLDILEKVELELLAKAYIAGMPEQHLQILKKAIELFEEQLELLGLPSRDSYREFDIGYSFGVYYTEQLYNEGMSLDGIYSKLTLEKHLITREMGEQMKKGYDKFLEDYILLKPSLSGWLRDIVERYLERCLSVSSEGSKNEE